MAKEVDISQRQFLLNGHARELARQLKFDSNGQNIFEPTELTLITVPEPSPAFKEKVWELGKNIPPRPLDLPSFNVTTNSLEILKRRYLAKNKQTGEICETPDELIWRVSWNLACADLFYNGQEKEPAKKILKTAREFYKIMANHQFLPNSPTLMNAGLELQQLSACFVLPIEDSMEGIMETAKHTALIHKTGGGTGFAGSRLRPEGDLVGSTGREASGPLSFIKIYDTTTEAVKQGGTRRGANMFILKVDHPDIVKFVVAKDEDRSYLTNFNVSVGVTDKFMQAVEKNEMFDLINPRTGQVWYWKDEVSGQLKPARISARDLWKEIIKRAHACGDPGLIFLDEINRHNPTIHQGEIEATNPCGEQPLHSYESCNLGSINLAAMVKDGNIDWRKLGKTIPIAVHLLDNVVDMNKYPIPEIEEVTKKNRRIGLGVMGFADMLVQLGIPYDSSEALTVAEKVMSFIQEKAHQASQELAKERGVFPAWKGSRWDPESPYFNGKAEMLRNATVTTIAPTGTIGLIEGCEGQGIEPFYALGYTRRMIEGQKEISLFYVNRYFVQLAKERGFYSDELIEKIALLGNEGKSIQGLEEIPKEVRELFKTAHDVAPEWHVRIQAAFQKYTDNAVSKTINFPSEATVEDVEKAYYLAYKLGCKGITIYRDGSREGQIFGKAVKNQPVLVRREVIIPEEEQVKTAQQTINRKFETTFGNPIHITFTDKLHALKTDSNKLYWWPWEVFQNMQPVKNPIVAEITELGVERTMVLRSDPNLIKWIKNLKEGEGWILDAGRRKYYPSYAVGRALEIHCIELGLIDEKGETQLVWEHDLEPVSEERYEELKKMGVLGMSITKEVDAHLAGNGERGPAFCEHCGSLSQFDPKGGSCGTGRCYRCGYEKCS